MPQVAGGRGRWLVALAAIIIAGLLSRVAHTGFRVIDKYLGDALYAAMVYCLLRLTGHVARPAVWAAVLMLAVELFQLTGVAANMLGSKSLAVRIIARLMGTEFSLLDLAAYAVGIACMAIVDGNLSRVPRPPE